MSRKVDDGLDDLYILASLSALWKGENTKGSQFDCKLGHDRFKERESRVGLVARTIGLLCCLRRRHLYLLVEQKIGWLAVVVVRFVSLSATLVKLETEIT